MTVESFANSHRLKTRLDDCGDKIIPGKRGHLYIDGGQLCLMVTDGAIAHQSRWQALGGKLWMGDKSPHPKTGRRVQDVSIKGIPIENADAAIRMARAKQRRIITDEERARILAIGASTRFNSGDPGRRRPFSAVESIPEAQMDAQDQET